jgi:hypothetical protein
MTTEERLQDAMAACRVAIAPSPDFFDRLEERAVRRRQGQRRVRVLVAAAAAVTLLVGALAVAANQRSATGGAARLKQQFVAQANQICDRATHTVELLGLSRVSGASHDETMRTLSSESSADETAIAELHALPAPASDRATVTAMLGHFDEAMDASLTVVAVAEVTPNSNSDAFTSAQGAASEKIGRAAKAALDYGIASCAQLIFPPRL